MNNNPYQSPDSPTPKRNSKSTNKQREVRSRTSPFWTGFLLFIVGIAVTGSGDDNGSANTNLVTALGGGLCTLSGFVVMLYTAIMGFLRMITGGKGK